MAPPQAARTAHSHATSGRVPQLDSIRGIAAATVVCHHWWLIGHFHAPPWVFLPLVAGRQAVILFFVLSGYVLSLPFWNGRQPSYPEYLVRRVFRIYVPFLFSLILSSVGCLIFYGSHLPLTSFYLKTWQVPLTTGLFAHQLLMPSDSPLNGAIWSLRFEMEMSIIFPFLCMLLVRLGSHSWMFLVVALRVAQMLLAHSHLGKSFTAQNLSEFLYYSIFFIVGAALARERSTLTRLVSLTPRPILWAYFLITMGLYYNYMFVTGTIPVGDFLTMLGAGAAIILVQDSRLKLGFDSVVPRYFGRVSYSMYLIHYAVIFSIFNLAYRTVPMPGLAVLSGVATLIVSYLFCIAVEEPAQLMGKRISHRLRRATAVNDLVST